MGQSRQGGKKHDLVDEVIQLMAKAGYEVPSRRAWRKCAVDRYGSQRACWISLTERVPRLEAALWKASEEGRYPVLCAQSPCLHRMKRVMRKMRLYEPAEFIMKYLVPQPGLPSDGPSYSLAPHLLYS